MKKSARDWNMPMIVTDYGISPAKYYEVYNFMEPLIAERGLHKADLGGYKLKFVKGEVVKKMEQKFNFFLNYGALYFWKVSASYGFVTQIAQEMGKD
jgi:hypothetical protein